MNAPTPPDPTASENSAQARAGRFLRRLGEQAVVTAQVFTPGRAERPVFVKALTVLVPTLALGAAVHLGTAAPSAVVQINGDDPVTVESIADLAQRAQVLDLETMKTIADCLQVEIGKSYPLDAAQIKLILAGMHASLKVNDEIQQWAQETGRAPREAVAALCAEPTDWKGKLATWDAKTEALGQALRSRLTDDAFANTGARAQTMRLAMDDAVRAEREARRFYGAQAVQVRSSVNIGALVGVGAALAVGASKLLSDQAGVDTVNNTANTVRQVGGWAQSAANIAGYSNGMSQAHGVSSLLNSIGSNMQNRAAREESQRRQIENQFERLNSLRLQEAQVVQKLQSGRSTPSQTNSDINRLNSIRTQQGQLVRQMRQQGVPAETIDAVLAQPPRGNNVAPAIVPPVRSSRMAP